MAKYEVELPGKEELHEQVIDACVTRVLDGFYSEYGRGDNGLRGSIEHAVVERVAVRIDGEVERIVRETLETTVQPTNEFGEAKGSPISMRERIAKQVELWFTEPVDRNGRPERDINYHRYDEKTTRPTLAISKAVSDIASGELRVAIDAATREVKAQLGEKVKTTVAESVKRLLGIPS